MTIDTTSFADAVLEQASAWIVRLRSDQASEQDQQDFALWLAELPENRAAFDEMMILWEAMGTGIDASDAASSITALLGRVTRDNGPSASNDDPTYGVSQQSAQAILDNTYPKPFPALATFAAMAASILVVAFVFLASNSPLQSELVPEQTLYATPVGKQQRFVLEDGSMIELNTGSQVAVSYTKGIRNLHLLQGEAYFKVSPDKSRPFVVTAGAGQVTAVGTAFNIQLSPGGAPIGTMVVAVTEGHVAVTDSETKNHRTVPVALGQQTRVNTGGQVGAVQAADLSLITAWREKTLIFRATDLATALTELNRYLSQPVDTSDPSLHNLNVSGTFSLEEPEVTLDAIVEAFDLQSYRNPFDNKRRLYLR